MSVTETYVDKFDIDEIIEEHVRKRPHRRAVENRRLGSPRRKPRRFDRSPAAARPGSGSWSAPPRFGSFGLMPRCARPTTIPLLGTWQRGRRGGVVSQHGSISAGPATGDRHPLDFGNALVGATAVAARLLVPGDYGIMAIAMAMLAGRLCAHGGRFRGSRVLVQGRRLTGDSQARLAGLAILFGTTESPAMVLLPQSIAAFFATPKSPPGVRVLATLTLIEALQVLPGHPPTRAGIPAPALAHFILGGDNAERARAGAYVCC